MKITLLRSKIQNAKVTEANPEYRGSITVCGDLMQKAGLYPFEKVEVNAKDKDVRIQTYVIPTDEKGAICLNGGAAQYFEIGDEIHILAFGEFHVGEVIASNTIPKIISVDENNNFVENLNV